MKRLFSFLSTWHLAAVGMIATIVFVLMLLNVAAVHAESHTAPPAFAAGDIQFCPKGKAYLDAKCSTVRTTMHDAIHDAYDAAAAGISGTIYVEGEQSYSDDSNDNTGDPILIEGFNYGTSLTIQGGAGSGTTTFVRQLSLSNNTDLDFTLADVTLTSSITGDDGLNASTNTGSITLQNVIANNNDVNGVNIAYQEGNILLEQTTINNNGDYGSYFDEISGSVNISNSSADSNTNGNIFIVEITGDAVLDQVTANGSTAGEGIAIAHCWGKKGVSLNSVTVNNNHTINLDIGNVTNNATVINTTANTSGDIGMLFYNVHGKNGVSLINTTASGNNLENINIHHVDNGVSLSNVQANGSLNQHGLRLANISGNKGISFKGVTTNDNNGYNIYVSNVAGNASLTTVAANNSTLFSGIALEGIQGTKGVTMKDIVASDNCKSNIVINQITGNANLSDVEASNSEDNAGISMNQIDGTKGVTLKDVITNNNTLHNIHLNLIAGNVSLSGITANSSVNSMGLSIQNIAGTKGVTLNNLTAEYNHANNVYMWNITGNVTLSNVNANLSGAPAYTSGDCGVSISSVHGSKGVTLKNVTADDNYNANISIYTVDGNASLSGVNASGSINSSGISLSSIAGSKGVTMKTVTANENWANNINIANITSNVSLSGVTANLSQDQTGININSILGSKGITLKSITAKNNDSHNIYGYTISGNVSMSSVTANQSTTSDGIWLEAVDGLKGISFKNVVANYNDQYNVFIWDIAGNVIISGFEANYSTDMRGLGIFDVDGSKGVSLKNAVANNNYMANFNIANITLGNVVFTSITGNDSTVSNGIGITNVAGVVIGINGTFTGNSSDGLEFSNITGQVSLKNIISDSNDTGAFMITDSHQLVCSSQFSNNSNWSINSTTSGDSLTLSQVTRSGNGFGDPPDPPLTNGGFWSESTKCKVIPPP